MRRVTSRIECKDTEYEQFLTLIKPVFQQVGEKVERVRIYESEDTSPLQREEFFELFRYVRNVRVLEFDGSIM